MATNNIYRAGTENNLRYANRSTIQVGLRETGGVVPVTESLRGVVIIDVASKINTALAANSAYTPNSPYSVLHCSLALSSANGKTGGNLYAFMLPINSPIDDSVSWDKPSENPSKDITLWTPGGSIEPLAEGIIQKGSWSGENVSFDITPFVNIWKGTTKPNFALMITSDENTKELWEFHSQQAPPSVVGGNEYTGVVFLGAGDVNSYSCEGVAVKIAPILPNLTLESVDSSTEGKKRWSGFNASISIGETFSMFLPDLKSSASVYTLVDKRYGDYGFVQMVISGETAGLNTEKSTTAEFSAVARVPSGSGIVEFASPSNSLVADISTLLPNEPVIFDYIPTTTPNNAKSYTTDFYADERLKNNRVRLYVKEQTASENRSSLNTTIRRNSIKPRLSLTLAI
jgi:hypothetical protein